MKVIVLDHQQFEIDELFQFIRSRNKVELGENARKAILKCREYLNDKMENTEGNIYGINTGFGSLYDQSISKEDLAKLQVNLVRSHA